MCIIRYILVTMDKQIGRRITRLREAQGLSKAELARRAKITRATLVWIEDGSHLPTVATLGRLARALGVKVKDLL